MTTTITLDLTVGEAKALLSAWAAGHGHLSGHDYDNAAEGAQHIRRMLEETPIRRMARLDAKTAEITGLACLEFGELMTRQAFEERVDRWVSENVSPTHAYTYRTVLAGEGWTL